MQVYSNNLLQQIKEHIQNGGVIAYPTEFCYGFGCDPFNHKAIKKILKLKGRSQTKGLIVIAGNIKQLDKLIIPLKDKTKIDAFWPGFYSIILKTTPHVPHLLTGKHSKIAVRVSRHNIVRQMCAYLDSPLVSTSANKTGHKPIRTYKECIRQFGTQVMVLPGNTNFEKKPSTIIDWDTFKVLR